MDFLPSMEARHYEVPESDLTMRTIQERVLSQWEKNDLERIIMTANPDGPEFKFLEGPPTANGRPHVGHVMTRTIKDTVLRYKTMRGFRISRRNAGWDCHGLGVEIEAEKHFKINQKQKIEEIGIGRFNAYCRESALTYIEEWQRMDRLLGYSVDHNNPYVTMSPEFMESVWWAVKQFHELGLLYKDYKIVPYCPRCGTPLASHELSQGYKDVKDPSVYIKFRCADEDAYFLAWTTTPWTLPSNEFLAVSPDEIYSLVEFNGEKLYLMKDRIANVLGEDAREIRQLRGSELEGRKYIQIIPFLKAPEGSLKVICADFVGKDDGTGIVHIAPAFGQDDFEVGKKLGVRMLKPVDESGKFSDRSLPWYGKPVKEADPEIIRYLKEKRILLKSEKILHSYPFCYRCDSPILYYPLDTWYLAVSKLREKLTENNLRINWFPQHLRDGRFGNFIAEAKDWALSRNRYWGTPLPVWRCNNNHIRILTRRKEIFDLTGINLEDLHRPHIDQVVFECSECGEQMTREPYVMDTWFDSGSVPFAALEYPARKEFRPDVSIPVDFVSEGMDQTRGWFYVMHVIQSAIFGAPAFSNCITMEFVLDSEGKKMSKSRGNSVLAMEALSEYSGDELRMFLSHGAPWKPRNFDRKVILEISRKSLYTLLNIYSFFASNANLDEFTYSGIPEGLRNLDIWLLSRVNSSIGKVTASCDSYMFHEGLGEIESLIDQFSNFYLRLSRNLFWKDGMDPEKMGAYSVMYYALDRISRMLAPWAPFFSDYLYTRISRNKESVHAERYPEAEPDRIDASLEKRMERVIRILEMARRARQGKNIKMRHPVKEILICADGITDQDISVILPELNARDVRIIAKDERPVLLTAKVNYQIAAPVLKERVKELSSAASQLTDIQIKKIASGEAVRSSDIEIKPEFLTISYKVPDNFIMEVGPEDMEIFISLEKDRSLQEEALAREVVRRIQVMRKEMRLNYDEKILAEYMVRENASEYGDVDKALENQKDYIKSQTLCLEFKKGNAKTGHVKEWDIDGLIMDISLTRADTKK